MKLFLYFVAAITLALCVYAFSAGVTVISIEQQQQTAAKQDSSGIEGQSKTAIARESGLLCKIESFWAKYNVWGNTDTVYRPSGNGAGSKTDVDESRSCS